MPSAQTSGPKVLQLIRCIPTGEDKDVIAFLNSPLVGESHAGAARMVLLYQTARKEQQVEGYGTADENIRRVLWRKLWPGKSENAFDTSYRRLLSDLMAALGHYLRVRQLHRQPALSGLALGSALLDLNVSEGLGQFLFNQMEGEMGALPVRAGLGWKRIRLQEQHLLLEQRHQGRQYRPELEVVANGYGQAALTQALQQYCMLRTYMQGLGKGKVPTLVVAMRQLAAQHAQELDLLGSLYLQAADLLDEVQPSPASVRAWVQRLAGVGEEVDAEELVGLFRIGINCAALAERNDKAFAGLLREVYAVLMAHPHAGRQAVTNPMMMSQLLRITVKAKEKDMKELQRQFAQFISGLPPAEREKYAPFMEAVLQYHQGQHQRSYDRFGECMVASRDPFIRLISLKYKVRILFDAEEVLLTEARLAAQPGPRKARDGSKYASVDLVLERYRKASDYGGGLAPAIMAYHQQFYRQLRELNHIRFGEPAEADRRTAALREALETMPDTEDYQWLRGRLGEPSAPATA